MSWGACGLTGVQRLRVSHWQHTLYAGVLLLLCGVFCFDRQPNHSKMAIYLRLACFPFEPHVQLHTRRRNTFTCHTDSSVVLQGVTRRLTPWFCRLATVATGGEVPSRFKRALDEATGRHYWYDKETRETFWTLAEAPAAVPLYATPEDPRQQRKSEIGEVVGVLVGGGGA